MNELDRKIDELVNEIEATECYNDYELSYRGKTVYDLPIHENVRDLIAKAIKTLIKEELLALEMEKKTAAGECPYCNNKRLLTNMLHPVDANEHLHYYNQAVDDFYTLRNKRIEDL